jgi:hypothetical protein
VQFDLNEKTAELRLIILDEASNWATMRKRLKESLGYFTDIQSKLGGLVEITNESRGNYGNRRARADDAMGNDFAELMLKLNSIDAEFTLSFQETIDKIESLSKKLSTFSIANNRPIQPAGSSVQNADKNEKVIQGRAGSTIAILTDLQQAELFSLCTFLVDFEINFGSIPELEIGEHYKGFYKSILDFAKQDRNLDKGDFKNWLNRNGAMFDSVLAHCDAIEAETGISHLAKKINDLQWLKWRTSFLF